ncbi:hypothetical protein [Pyxidicoccus xibeiensis]|uniref:hypothetical protein n=1 Tax=Pyxidicoccus xibeiensis TaxID=2906759 RepID=UPI0020A8236D|nr:hypothetical protein [Pyxidicoccus xibeiensis]MCP3137363.1 hypothetical protein [Pyxidicoccus xibeiensis]
MAVVINELEVVSEPPSGTASSGGATGEAGPSASGVQRAHDLELELERRRVRRERARAH